MTKYRVRRVVNPNYAELVGKEPAEETVWEGEDLAQLSANYPVSNIPWADPFETEKLFGNDFLWRFEFQMYERDDWIPCSDPRVSLCRPPTELEQQLYAVNRRVDPQTYNKGQNEGGLLSEDDLIALELEEREPYVRHWLVCEASTFKRIMLSWLSLRYYNRR